MKTKIILLSSHVIAQFDKVRAFYDVYDCLLRTRNMSLGTYFQPFFNDCASKVQHFTRDSIMQYIFYIQ